MCAVIIRHYMPFIANEQYYILAPFSLYTSIT